MFSAGDRRAESNRKSAESVARHLLGRLEKAARPDSGLAGEVGRLESWEDSSGYSHTTSSSSTASSGLEQGEEWGRADEGRLRDHISRLKVI